MNFSPGAQKRNLRWPSSTVSPGFTALMAYSSPLMCTPLALLLSTTFQAASSSTNRACCRLIDWWSMAMSFSSLRPIFTSVRMRKNSFPRTLPVRPTRRGISPFCRSRASTCGAPFMMSLTRMMAVAPPAVGAGVAAPPGAGEEGEAGSGAAAAGSCPGGWVIAAGLCAIAPGGMVVRPIFGWVGGGVLGSSIRPWTPRS